MIKLLTGGRYSVFDPAAICLIHTLFISLQEIRNEKIHWPVWQQAGMCISCGFGFSPEQIIMWATRLIHFLILCLLNIFFLYVQSEYLFQSNTQFWTAITCITIFNVGVLAHYFDNQALRRDIEELNIPWLERVLDGVEFVIIHIIRIGELADLQQIARFLF